MRGLGPIGLVLLPVALVVLAAESVWPRIRAVGEAFARWPPVARLYLRVGRLPVAFALPLFLIPEACSRLGWVISAWLVVHGEPWRALAVYGGTKLIAGSLALWVCSATLPVLLGVRVFAAVHGGMLRSRAAAMVWLRRRTGRLDAAMAQVRARRAAAAAIRAQSSAADPASATPSAPAGPSPTG